MLSPAPEIKAAFEHAPVPVMAPCWRCSAARLQTEWLGAAPIDRLIDLRLRGDSINLLCTVSIFLNKPSTICSTFLVFEFHARVL